MIGDLMDVAFYHVKDTKHVKGLNWRLMLASVSSGGDLERILG